MSGNVATRASSGCEACGVLLLCCRCVDSLWQILQSAQFVSVAASIQIGILGSMFAPSESNGAVLGSREESMSPSSTLTSLPPEAIEAERTPPVARRGAEASSASTSKGRVTSDADAAADTPRFVPSCGEQRHCPSCLVWYPLNDFRIHRRRDGITYRANKCNSCHSAVEAARKSGRDLRKDNRVLHTSWALLAKHERKRLALEGLIVPLWKRFGGSIGIANAWWDAYQEASAAQRVRAIEALRAIIKWTEDNLEVVTEKSPGEMSDEDLEAELARARIDSMADLIKNDLEAAQSMAGCLGYRLEPISES